MGEVRELTDEEIEQCILFALERCSKGENIHTLLLPDAKNQMQHQELSLHSIDLAAYVSSYSQNKIQILKKEGHQYSSIGDIIVRNCHIKNGTTTSHNGAILYFDTCLIGKIDKYPLIKAKNCKIEELEAPLFLEIRKSSIDNITLRNCSGLHIKNSKVRQLSISSESRFHRGIKLSNTEIELPPNGLEYIRTTNNNIHINDVTFHDKESLHALCNFRTLKKLCHECEHEHGVILFHGLELETYYNSSLKYNCPFSLWPEKISHWFHRGLTDYGRDVMRPFLCIAYLFILGTWVASAYYNLDIIDSARLSFKHSVGPMNFALNNDAWKKLEPAGYGIFNFIHVVTSSIIWFLIIFMLRRRFKI